MPKINEIPQLYYASLVVEALFLVREYDVADRMRDEWIRIKAQVPDLRDFDPEYWHHRQCESISWDRFANALELNHMERKLGFKL